MRRVALLVLALALAAPAAAATKPLKVLFPEGYSARQMTDRVAAVRRIAIAEHRKPALTGAAYAAAVATAKPPAGFGRPASVEGFLFPSVYYFDTWTPASRLVANQIATFRSEWTKVRVPAGRSPYQVLTVASMVEREAAVPGERKLVAAVIWNRLDKGMPLGIDATIRYGLGIPGNRPLTAKELATDSPYNTRLHPGLPPTPVGNPGLPSMLAAASPAPVDYLYYVRIPGTQRHFFTADETEFCAKVAEYGYKGC